MNRILFILLLVGASAFGQSSRFPDELRAYLGLTELQVTNIVNHQSAFFDVVEAEEDRQYSLLLEIRRELAKPQPDPAVVGTKTIEVEMIDRGLETKYMETIGLIRKELAEPQTAKMKALEDAYRLAGLIEQAQDAGLWNPDLENGPFFLFSAKPEIRSLVNRAKKKVQTRRQNAQR